MNQQFLRPDTTSAGQESAEVEPIEVETEIDRRLAPFRRRVWKRLGAAVLVFLALEFLLIFFIFSDRNVLRAQTFNGALTMVGGLTVFTLGALLLVLPAKLIAVESLKQIKEAQRLAYDSSTQMNAFIERVDPIVKKVDSLIETLDKRSGQAILDLKEESGKIRLEVEKVSKAFTQPIKGVGAGRPMLKPGVDGGNSNGTNGEPARQEVGVAAPGERPDSR